MLDSLYKSTKETIAEFNPVADNIRKQDKKIIDCLIANGFKGKEIVNFVDVYKSDVKEYIAVQKEAIKQAKKMIAAKEVMNQTATK